LPEQEKDTEPSLEGDFGTRAGRGFLSASRLTLPFSVQLKAISLVFQGLELRTVIFSKAWTNWWF